MGAENRYEWKNITGMALIAKSADFKNGQAWYSGIRDAFFEKNTSSAQAVLRDVSYILIKKSFPMNLPFCKRQVA